MRKPHQFEGPTPASILAAQNAQARERAEFTSQTGVKLSESGDPLHGQALRDVLMIDDDQEAVEIFGHVLSRAGYRVRTANEGAAGLVSALNARPDAIILDSRMPLLDGLSFLRQYRSDSRGEHVPVAVVTGDYLIDDAVLAEFKKLGAVVRFKPLWSEDLVELVAGLRA
jgi:CheY-like chemotaxis protein